MNVVVTARQRLYGLTPEQCRSQEAGTVLGRLYLAKLISYAEKEAGIRFGEIHAKAKRALQAPDTLARGGGGSAASTGDLVSEDYIDWAMKAVAKWEVAKIWMRAIGSYGGAELLRACVCEQEPKSVDNLRHALDRMVYYLGIEKELAAA